MRDAYKSEYRRIREQSLPTFVHACIVFARNIAHATRNGTNSDLMLTAKLTITVSHEIIGNNSRYE
ncbi:hypothetical protein X777_08436 [Ooceraea biroi]|uniref:Uncharacterized protein n=1 Tax=Ooceraea biroi TaxID=2015173 RepID=A0A026X1G1_OOCBI|nr:hypothetical protein X777_08436 [Ooceraea biroi]